MLKKLISYIFIYIVSASLIQAHEPSVELTCSNPTCILSAQDAQKAHQALTCNPSSLLQGILDCHKKQNSLLKTHQLEQVRTNIETFKKHCHIGWVSECNTCSLSRTKNQDFREKYETTALKMIRQYCTSPISNYVSFASGDLFQDLVILSKAFNTYAIPASCKTLNIHLIDPSFYTYISLLNVFELTPYDISQETEAMIQRIHSAAGAISSQSDQTKILWPTLKTHCQLSEFIAQIQQTASLPVRFFIHDSVDAYVDFCNTNSNMNPNIITTIDFDTSAHECSSDFHKLLSKKLNASNCAVFCDKQKSQPKILHTLQTEYPFMPLYQQKYPEPSRAFINTYTRPTTTIIPQLYVKSSSDLQSSQDFKIQHHSMRSRHPLLVMHLTLAALSLILSSAAQTTSKWL